MNLKNISIKYNFLALGLLWIALTSAAPFTFIQIPYHPHKYLIVLILSVFIISFLARKKNFYIGDRTIWILLAIQMIYFLFASMFHEDAAFLALFFQALAILIAYLFSVNYIKLESLINSILIFTCFMVIAGFLAFFLAYFEIITPVAEYINPDGRPLYNYILTFSNYVIFMDSIQIVRVAGYFDEPGTFAFFIIHALILNKLYFDSKKIELILIVGGVVTLSMAFFISIFLYMCFFYFRLKALSSTLLLILAVASISYVVFDHDTDSKGIDKMYAMTFARFEKGDNEDRFVSGDSRTEDMVLGIEMVKEKPFFGYGLTYIKEQTNYGLHTIIGPIVTQGLIGFLVLFAHVLNICRVTYLSNRISKEKIDQMLCVFILLINYIQRPFVFSFYTYILLICIYVIINRKAARSWNENISKKLIQLKKL
jgi:hypothetical protein